MVPRGFRPHDPGERIAKEIVNGKISSALQLMRNIRNLQHEIHSREKQLSAPGGMQVGKDVAGFMSLPPTSRSLGTTSRSSAYSDASRRASVHSELRRELHEQRVRLHRVVKIYRAKERSLVETAHIQIILWAGYGDPNGQQTECTQTLQGMLQKQHQRSVSHSDSRARKTLSFRVDCLSLQCSPSGQGEPCLTILYLGTSTARSPTKQSCGLSFTPKPVASPSMQRILDDGFDPEGFQTPRGEGWGGRTSSALLSSQADWDRMVDFIDDNKLWLVLTEYKSALHNPEQDQSQVLRSFLKHASVSLGELASSHPADGESCLMDLEGRTSAAKEGNSLSGLHGPCGMCSSTGASTPTSSGREGTRASAEDGKSRGTTTTGTVQYLFVS